MEILPNPTIYLMSPLIQWNCNGVFSHYSRLRQLLANLQQSCFCLQETFLKIIDVFSYFFVFFFCIPYGFYCRDHACDGVAILIRNSLCHDPLNVEKELQVVAIRVALLLQVTLNSINLPPAVRIDINDVTGI